MASANRRAIVQGKILRFLLQYRVLANCFLVSREGAVSFQGYVPSYLDRHLLLTYFMPLNGNLSAYLLSVIR